MDSFRDASQNYQLVVMGYVGFDFIQNCCLDHALSTNSWLQLFLLSKMCHLNPCKSNHLPLLVEIRSFHSTHPNSRKYGYKESCVRM